MNNVSSELLLLEEDIEVDCRMGGPKGIVIGLGIGVPWGIGSCSHTVCSTGQSDLKVELGTRQEIRDL